jgi:uncharacterized protein (DUF488 family)
VEIFTIGFTRKSAERFFGLLREHGIQRVVDVRVSNTSQLAGYAKRDDLAYFLQELCHAEYVHEPLLTPPLDLMHAYRHREMTWDQYADAYVNLIAGRHIEDALDRGAFETKRTVLLCAEPTVERCHRRLVVEYLDRTWSGVNVTHL